MFCLTLPGLLAKEVVALMGEDMAGRGLVKLKNSHFVCLCLTGGDWGGPGEERAV